LSFYFPNNANRYFVGVRLRLQPSLTQLAPIFTMTLKETFLKRIDFILANGKNAFETGKRNEYGGLEIDSSKMRAFKTSGQSFILQLFGKDHPYYTEFSFVTRSSYGSSLNGGIGIIENIKTEISDDWLSSVKGIVSAEIYTDFLDMANHLLENDYKDAAAVMIGGVLEEHLRQLCNKNGIDTHYEKDGKQIPLKADRMNSELAKAGVYNKLDQKSIIAQLDLRNNAAHGSYDEFDKKQVELMHSYVFDFISRQQL
jgi:hypothetical protein